MDTSRRHFISALAASTVMVAAGAATDAAATAKRLRGRGATPPPVATEFIQFGSALPGTWTISAVDVRFPDQGPPGSKYITSRAKAGWLTVWRDTIRDDDIHWHGVGAANHTTQEMKTAGLVDVLGIKHVDYCMNDGPLFRVSQRTIHPVWGRAGFYCPIRRSDAPWSGEHELVAIVTPVRGKPYILQGTLDPKTASWPHGASIVAYNNSAPGAWSQRLNIDKTSTALPQSAIFKAADNDPRGNDANDGLTAGAPVRTWDVAMTKLRARHLALHGSADVGGGKVYLLDSLDHEYGIPTATPTLNLCATQWFKILPAPGIDSGAVRIARAVAGITEWGIRVERLWVGVNTSTTIKNADPHLNKSQNYFDMIAVNTIHDGIEYGFDTTYGEEYRQPLGPGPYGLAFGHGMLFNVTTKNCGVPMPIYATVAINWEVDTISETTDVARNLKVISNFTVRNCIDIPDSVFFGNHLDPHQFVFGCEDFYHEDMDFDNTAQGYFTDSANRQERGATVRCRFASTGGLNPQTFTVGKTPLDWFFYDITTVGGTDNNGWPASVAARAENVSFTMLPGNNIGKYGTDFRFGKNIYYQGVDAREPDVEWPGANASITLLGSRVRWYVDAKETASLTIGAGDVVTEARTYIDPAGTYSQRGLGGVGTSKPVYAETAFGPGLPGLDMNGATAAFTTNWTDALMSGNVERHIFGSVDLDASPSTFTAFLFCYGAASVNGNCGIGFKTIGGTPRAIMKVCRAGTPYEVNNTGVTATGKCVVYGRYDGAGNVSVTLYNAAAPGGDGAALSIGGSADTAGGRVAVGASNTLAAGGFPFVDGRIGRVDFVTGVMTGPEITAMLNLHRAAIGL